MPSTIKRYQNQALIEHLAQQYVLGTQPIRVRKRISRLRMQYTALDQRIDYWEQKFAPLNNKTPEISPKKTTLKAIEQQLQFNQKTKNSFHNWFGLGFYQATSALSVFFLALALFVLQPKDKTDPLSYLAVMNDTNQQPQLVAATYGNSRTLSIELIDTPTVPNEMSLELWVTSKTDNQVRSLGVIPTTSNVFNRPLSEPEWRLIKDSENLLLTLEEKGGSSIGEPMGVQVSKGPCIRMAGWQENS
ncbi:anti-sigma factor [uncultured Pseudoalteromonas sp.]|uniref:anti-sigma factor n=1 Tax=uncultured Pseudoalteromonas sp. TaxID=114053 RepID=UPI0030D89B84|tara:strand:+ start:3234 stop:3971 length:738 start_codon:yes stop_codon:yes gene_type:complete